MDIYNVLALMGGLALFLFGMDAMGTGLRKISGGKLEQVLERMTSTLMRGVLLGAAVTAVIQSSSATTVMVVGFVNSGIMQLTQSIGIIMGANIGTTVTAWILSLTGLEGDALIVQILKPSTFAPLFAFVGIAMIMFARSLKVKDIGTILIGFGVLMIGMTMMSDAVKPLASSEGFANLLMLFTNPFFGVLAGAVLTAIIQSSSASVGILQALSLSGGITYGIAIPIIVGQNIGTCVTALISCIGANKNAKRAAMVHLYFNIIGAVVLLSIFYLINAFVHFGFLNNVLNPANIAVVHTAFNLLTTTLLLPFYKQLGHLATLTIREKKEPEEVPLLDERFLATPSFAIELCKNATSDMARTAQKNLFRAMEALQSYNKNIADEIEEREKKLDKFEDAIGTYLVKLTGNELSLSDRQAASMMLHAIGDFERIGDHAIGILGVAQELHEKKLDLSDRAKDDVKIMTDAVRDIVTLAFEAIENDDIQKAYKVEPLEQVVDYLKAELKRRHIERLQEGVCTIEMGFIFSDLVNNYERVSDHCSNLAVYVIQIREDQLDSHEYLQTIRQSGQKEYLDNYKAYKAKYKLPS